MSVGRVVSSVFSCVAVVGCAVVVVGMTRAASAPTADEQARVAASPTRTERPPFLPGPSGRPAGTSARAAAVSPSAVPATTTRAAGSTVAAPPAASVVPTTPARVAVPVSTSASAPAPRTTSAPAVRLATTSSAPRARTVSVAPRPAAVTGRALPLRYSTGTATRVITVTAGSAGSTHARLQAWTKVSTGRWKTYGTAVTANVGADGIGTASESRSKTPAGSWTLTRAFGRYGDPGTALPYFRTTPSDYWISTAGSRYNTHQRCSSCGYNNGVNERLHYVNPQYNYSVVIDYNTRNAPGGVQQGRGSAFFLHVSVGQSTAGCIAIPSSKLVSLMRWLSPGSHPRILIGVV